MLTSFLSWTAAGLFARVALAHVLRSQWRRRWAVPPALAGAAIYTGGALSAQTSSLLYFDLHISAGRSCALGLSRWCGCRRYARQGTLRHYHRRA